MDQKQISRFPLNEKFSGLSGLTGHVTNYDISHLANTNENESMARALIVLGKCHYVLMFICLYLVYINAGDAPEWPEYASGLWIAS